MYILPLKRWFAHIHTPKAHDFGLRLGHLVHDDRFWAVVALAVLAAILLVIAIFTEPGNMPVTPSMPIYFP